jgi:2-phosphoglycerate kinase
MIYLIGGSPRSGKSILSRKLSKELNIPYISTDNLRLVVLPYFKGKNKYKNFPYIKMFNLIKVDRFFMLYSGREMLKADIKEARSIYPGVKSLIDHLIDCKMDYIIEGVHLLPSLIKKLKNNKKIKVVFLVKENEKKIYQGLIRNKNKNDWIASDIKNQKIIITAAKSLGFYGKYFIKETKKYRFNCVNTENLFFKQINKAQKYFYD